jgi:hypothetical protein
VAIVTAVFADDRQVGRVSDARQMIQTAVAMVTTGEVGVARGIQIETTVRPGGDAAARYGLGMSLAQAPAAALAPSFESAFGLGASQSLFLVAPILFGLLAAAAAGRAAGLLGAGERGQAIAVLLASLGSPLGAYFSSDLSESLQAACLAGAFLAALEARRREGVRRSLLWAGLAGLAVGTAVLAKSSLAAVAPFALLPLLAAPKAASAASRGARVAAAALGSVAPLAIWLAGEYARFGGPFRGYGGEAFSYPFLEGAARLLLLPNKGLLFFFPAIVVALVEAARRLRGSRLPGGVDAEAGASRLEVLAGCLPLAVLVAMAAPWWAWHGVAGWGPRLVVPGIPLVAALAACAVERWRPSRGRLLVAASLALNALPLLQSSVPVAVYMTKLGTVEVSQAVARRYTGFTQPAEAGTGRLVPGVFVINEVPLASDHVSHGWLLRVRSARDARERALRLEAPPWRSVRPDLRSVAAPFTPRFTAAVAPPLGVGFLGRSVVGGEDPAGGDAYVLALANQVLRAQQQRKLDRALRLSNRLFALNPRGESAALVAETYRLLGRHETLRAFLDSLPRDVRGTPPVFAVLALAARDVGETQAARAYLERAAGLGMPAVEEALSKGPSEWPADFVAFVADDRLATGAALPALGGKAGPAAGQSSPAR